MSEAFIAGGVRTPIGAFGGALSTVRTDDLAAHAIRGLMTHHHGVDAELITDVVMGCSIQAGEDNRNVSRMALLLAGLPMSVPGETVNRLCASGLSAAVSAARGVRNGEGDLYVAGGVENMTRAPYVIAKAAHAWARDAQLYDTTLGWRFINPAFEAKFGVDPMGVTAENVAAAFHVTRQDQDAFAVRSQQKAAAARTSGRLSREIVPVHLTGKKGATTIVEHDEFLRPETTLDGLAKLKPAFRHDGHGSVTAGNSSGLNDGACAMFVASEAGCARHGLTPIARMVSWAAAGVEPRVMGIGPVPASRKAMAMAGITADQLDVIELNEAFAAQVLASLRELKVQDDDPRVNRNGGAIALGHPLGMSGARLALSAAMELQVTGGRYALVTMCIGVGQGMAAVLERV